MLALEALHPLLMTRGALLHALADLRALLGRQQLMALHDQTSKRMLQAMVDISRVLTPEQRAQIGERMKERAARHQERMERFQREHPQQPR